MAEQGDDIVCGELALPLGMLGESPAAKTSHRMAPRTTPGSTCLDRGSGGAEVLAYSPGEVALQELRHSDLLVEDSA